jgi:hypothetical protein
MDRTHFRFAHQPEAIPRAGCANAGVFDQFPGARPQNELEALKSTYADNAICNAGEQS